MAWWRLSLVVLAASCAHEPPAPEVTGPTLELRLDDGHVDAPMPLPPRETELILRFDPNLDGYFPLELRFLLAAPGHVVISLYKTSPKGDPGEAVQRIERDYSSAFVSNGKDGRWVVERLQSPPLRGPLWVGISSSDGGVRIWSSAFDSTWVFHRHANPSVSLYTDRVARTPMLRVQVAPRPSPR